MGIGGVSNCSTRSQFQRLRFHTRAVFWNLEACRANTLTHIHAHQSGRPVGSKNCLSLKMRACWHDRRSSHNACHVMCCSSLFSASLCKVEDSDCCSESHGYRWCEQLLNKKAVSEAPVSYACCLLESRSLQSKHTNTHSQDGCMLARPSQFDQCLSRAAQVCSRHLCARQNGFDHDAFAAMRPRHSYL